MFNLKPQLNRQQGCPTGGSAFTQWVNPVNSTIFRAFNHFDMSRSGQLRFFGSRCRWFLMDNRWMQARLITTPRNIHQLPASDCVIRMVEKQAMRLKEA